MARGFVFEPDDAGFQRFLRGPEVEGMLRDLGRAAVAGGEAAAPFDAKRRAPGPHYKEQFFAELEHNRKMDRPMIKFGNRSPLALIIEYGTRDTPAFRPIRKGLERARSVL